MKQEDVLGNHADGGAELPCRDVRKILSAQENPAGIRREESHAQVADGGLPRAARPDQGGDPAFGNRERGALQHRFARLVGKGDRPEFNRSIELLVRRRKDVLVMGGFRGDIQNFPDPRKGDLRFLHGEKSVHEPLQRRKDAPLVDGKGDQAAHGHVVVQHQESAVSEDDEGVEDDKQGRHRPAHRSQDLIP